MKKTPAGVLDPRLAPVQAAFLGDRQVTTGGTGFGSGALKVGGRIFAMISSRGEFVVKLPRERVDELVGRGQALRFEPGPGRVMNEWASVHSAPSSWIALAREARRFVGGGRAKRRRPRSTG